MDDRSNIRFLKSVRDPKNERQAAEQIEIASNLRNRWFLPSSCTGNCNQGRACDCLPAVETPEPAPTPLGWRIADAIGAIVLVGFVAALVFGVLK